MPINASGRYGTALAPTSDQSRWSSCRAHTNACAGVVFAGIVDVATRPTLPGASMAGRIASRRAPTGLPPARQTSPILASRGRQRVPSVIGGPRWAVRPDVLLPGKGPPGMPRTRVLPHPSRRSSRTRGSARRRRCRSRQSFLDTTGDRQGRVRRLRHHRYDVRGGRGRLRGHPDRVPAPTSAEHFTTVAGAPHANIAAIRADGTLDPERGTHRPTASCTHSAAFIRWQ